MIHGAKAQVRQAIILAGGQGTRMRPLTEDSPKALIPIAGKAILDWQLDWLAGEGVEHVVISCGYLAEVLDEHVSSRRWPLEIELAVEPESLGRGGGLRFAASRLPFPEERWLAFNGDVLTRFSLADFIDRHHEVEAAATIALAPYRTSWGIADLDEADRIRGFEQSPKLPYWINGGGYVFEPSIVELLPERGDHEDTTFPRLAIDGHLAGFKIDGYWRGVDTVKDVKEAGEEVTRMGW